ncbi:L,D-transpeptidase ErfK/SrfK [Gammaproteobacteria bacterium]
MNLVHVIRWAGIMLVALLAACAQDPFYWLLSPPRARVISRFFLPPSGTDVVGTLVAVHAYPQDTLSDIARYFDVGHDAILNANPKVDPWLPGKSTRILIPTQHILPPGTRRGIVINLAALRLYYYPADNRTVITHPTGIGRENWATPQGSTKVIAKEIDPPWRIPLSIRSEHASQGNPLPAILPAGPNNPLGQYALRLGVPGYLIHGTNRPYGIGMRVSHGCIQLYPEDISALFPNVPIGTQVTIINYPYLIGRVAGRPYLEAHPHNEDDTNNQKIEIMERLHQVMLETGVTSAEIDWNRALTAARMALGVPLPIYRGAPVAEAMLAAVSLVETGVIAGTWEPVAR